jgi:hypothetical protein
MLFDWGGPRIIGHDGGTIGQSSFLRLDPSRRFGVALLTNGGNTQGFSRKVLGEIFERADDGVTMPPLPEPTPGFAIDPERYVGRYGKLSSAYDVTVEDGRLVATATQRGPIESPGVVYDLEPIDDSSFATVARGTRLRGALTFLNPGEDGRFEYVRDSRLHRRTFR